MYTIENLKNILIKKGYDVCEYTQPVSNCKEVFVFQDDEGYFVRGSLDKLNNRPNGKFERFGKSNRFSILNINHFAHLHNIKATCISKEFDSKAKLKFICECGGTFDTTFENFRTSHKTKCNECTGYHNGYSYDKVKQSLKAHGLNLTLQESEYKGITFSPLICLDDAGYKYQVRFYKVMKGQTPEIFHPSNPFTLDNIKTFLNNAKLPFDCISEKFVSCDKPLQFKCLRCQSIFEKKWQLINVADPIESRRGHLRCPNCDGTYESSHASVLKQMFIHEYPDTIAEERSCVNPKTNHVLPTDIVNHKLRIAIEIQSQWHDYDDRKEIDKIKRDYWVGKKYDFYALDIRDYSVIEMCKLFFDIDKLPEYINFANNKTLNIKLLQNDLDNNIPVCKIAKIRNVSPHRIYDAIYSGRLQYPESYQNGCFTSVAQYDTDGNLIATYPSIKQAEAETNIRAENIASALHKNHKSGGFIWKRLNKE